MSQAIAIDDKLLVACRVEGATIPIHTYDLLTEDEVIFDELPPVKADILQGPTENIQVYELSPEYKPSGLLSASEKAAVIVERAHCYVYALGFATLKALPVNQDDTTDQSTGVHPRVLRVIERLEKKADDTAAYLVS
jgi:hypothetical protein